MVYYLVYRASKDYSNRSLIPSRLRSIGCKQIKKGFWETDRKILPQSLKIFERNQPIVLKRTREIRKRQIANGKVRDIGSLILVSFTVPKNEREKFRRLIKAAPCIRLCRGVYAFYHHQSKFDRENSLVKIDKLITFVKNMGGNVKVFPMLAVVDDNSMQRLIEEAKQQIEKEIRDIIQGCSEISAKISNNQHSREYLLYNLNRIRRQYAILNRKAEYFNKWLAIDVSKSLMKAYRSIIKIRRAIQTYFT